MEIFAFLTQMFNKMYWLKNKLHDNMPIESKNETNQFKRIEKQLLNFFTSSNVPELVISKRQRTKRKISLNLNEKNENNNTITFANVKQK